MRRYAHEISAACVLLLLFALLAWRAPSFFALANLRDVALASVPVLLCACGVMLVITLGQIDISIGSQFAICAVIAASVAKAGAPLPLVALIACICGASFGLLNGVLVAWWSVPSIVATLATSVILRESLRWTLQGEWIHGLGDRLQWFRLGQTGGEWLLLACGAAIVLLLAFGLRYLAAGRFLYAVGSNQESAALAGIAPRTVIASVFVLCGAFTGLAALLNASRFQDVPSNSGAGLELKAIAAVVVGGAALAGGRSTVAGTLTGVALLGVTGPALTFLGLNPFWERAFQGAVILLAAALEVVTRRTTRAR